MKINQSVEFFVNGLDRKSEEQKFVFCGKSNSLGQEDLFAKIFNFGNFGAYTACVKGESTSSSKFFLGVPKHKNPNQAKYIKHFFAELIELKESQGATVANMAYSLFVTKNVHLRKFYSVLRKEKEDSQNELDKNIIKLIAAKKQKSKEKVLENYYQFKIQELQQKQIEIQKKIDSIQEVEVCENSLSLKTLLSNDKLNLLNNVLIDSVSNLFKNSIDQINALSKEEIESINFKLVSTDQPHVEIVALNSLLDDENIENPFTTFTVGLDRKIGDTAASCPGCRSYFEGIKERNKVDILYISHTQLPRDFNLNGIIEQRKYDFLCKFKEVVLSIFTDVENNGTINNDEGLIRMLDEAVNGNNNLSSVFKAYEDLSDRKNIKKANKYISEKIDEYLSQEIGDKFYKAAKNFKEENKIYCNKVFSNLESAIIEDLLSKYAKIKGKNPEFAENIQKYIFSKFDNILSEFEQYKGENIDMQEGLYKDDIEYNLELIKKSIDNNLVKEKIMSISDIKIGQNQRLYIINPESENSKFVDILTNLEPGNVINANVQIDNSTCADHSLILLTKILQCNLPLHQIGIIGMENEYGKHASIYIIADNMNLSSEIDGVITSYKKEGKIIDKLQYFDNLLASKDVMDDLDYNYSIDAVGDNIDHLNYA